MFRPFTICWGSHTWKRTVPRWAGGRTEGTAHSRHTADVMQTASPGLSLMESVNGDKVMRSDGFYFQPSRLLCEAWQLTRYSARVSVASRPRTVSSSSWDMTPSTNKAIRAKGTQKPSTVRKQLLQRARRLALLVSLSGQSQDLFSEGYYMSLLKICQRQ